MYNLRCIIKKL